MTRSHHHRTTHAHARHTPLLALLALALSFLSSQVVKGSGYGDESVHMTTQAGFHVIEVAQDRVTQLIHVTLNISGGKNVVPLLYFSKENWGVSDDQQWNSRNHPCQNTDSDICCLNAFLNEYQVDPAVKHLAENDHICTSVDGQNSNNMGVDSRNNTVLRPLQFPGSIIDSALISDVPEGQNATYYGGGVTYKSIGTGNNYQILMTFPLAYFSIGHGNGHHARVTEPSNIGTFKYEFFIGVVFISLRQNSPDTFIHVTQQNVEFTKSDFMFFSVATEQTQTPIKSVDIFVHQGKADSGKIFQYIELYIGYDKSLYTGGIELDLSTLKWSRTDVYSVDPGDWNTPCGTEGYYGIAATADNDFDEANLFAGTTCLPETPTFCVCQEGRFWIPFRTNGTAPDVGYIAGPDEETNIFITMSVRLIKADNTTVAAEVFSTIDLEDFPVLEHCTASIMEYNSIADIMSVTVGMGLDRDTGSLLQQTQGIEKVINEFSTDGVMASYGAAAINMQFSMGKFFAADFGRGNKFQIDNMIILNFLGAENEKYNIIKQQITAGTAFNISRGDDQHAGYEMTPTFKCSHVVGKSIEMADFNCMWRRVIVNSEVPDDFKESVFYLDRFETTERKNFYDWADRSYFGGRNEANPVSKPYQPNARSEAYLIDRCNVANLKALPEAGGGGGTYTIRPVGDASCLFVDPGYRWISRTSDYEGADMNAFDISDKTIVAGVLSIRSATNQIVGRRLLTDMDGTGMTLHHFEESDSGSKMRLREAYQESRLRQAPFGGGFVDSNTVDETRRSLDRIEQRESAWKSRGVETKLSTLGNRALSRHLLQQNDQNEAAERLRSLKNSTSAQVFELTNAFVNPDINIAYITGHANASWQMFTWYGKRPASVSAEIFTSNINAVCSETANYLGSHVLGCKTTGITESQWDVEGQRVEVAGILNTGASFGAIYEDAFKCILSTAAFSDTHLTGLNASENAINCEEDATSDMVYSPTMNGVLLLRSCGVGTTAVPVHTCNKVYGGMVRTEPTIAPDWYFAAITKPKLAFSITTNKVFDTQDSIAAVYSVRTNLAMALSVDMDRIFVELRSTAIKSHFDVWVYTDDNTRGGMAWPPVDGASDDKLMDLYSTRYKDVIPASMKSVLGEISMESPAETSSFTKMAVSPELKDNAVQISVDFITRTHGGDVDVDKLKAAIKKELSHTLSVSQLDMRMLSLKTKPTRTVDVRITVELRLQGYDESIELWQLVLEKKSEMQTHIKHDLSDIVQTVTAVAPTALVEKNMRTNVPEDDENKKKSDMVVAVVVGSSIGVAALVAAASLGVYYYHHHRPLDYQSTPSPPKPTNPSPDTNNFGASASIFQPYYDPMFDHGGHTLDARNNIYSRVAQR